MYANYQAQLQNYNAQMSSLQDQLVTAMNNLNQASTQIETLKYQAQVNGINALVTALASQMNALGQGIIVQHIANENDAARVTQAIQQKRMSDRLNQTSQAVSTINALLSRAPGSGTSIQP
jgi:DNA repair exonuclease SbcCD ATPase subunit